MEANKADPENRGGTRPQNSTRFRGAGPSEHARPPAWQCQDLSAGARAAGPRGCTAPLGFLGDSVTASVRFMTGDRHHLRRDNAPVHAALTVQQFGAPKGMSPGPHLPRHLIVP